MRRACSGLVVLALAAACGRGPGAAASSPPTHVDSALPIAEHLERMRRAVPATDRLEGGAASPEELAGVVLGAVSREDTTALARLVLSKAEYAWLYYPNHIYHDPPYELDPETFWLLIRGNGEKGLARLLRRYGGRRLELRRLRCEVSTNVRAPVRELDRCALTFAVDGVEETRRMFGSIVSVGDEHKLVSFANEF